VVTQTVYLVGSPWFEDLNITVNGNSTLRIRASVEGNVTTNTGNGFGQENYYVQSLKVNGQEWDRNWFEHDDVMVKGGTIEFVLGDEVKVWESGVIPPSPGHLELEDI